MKCKKMIAAILLVMTIIFTSFWGIWPAMAETSETYYNIALVVDASGSLKSTDPEGNRYTAIDIFLQTLREKGNNVGSVVFTSQIEKDTGLSEMTSKSSKDALSEQIKSYVPDNGDTNIGLALETAIADLKNSNNDGENIILLLSDGNTDMGSTAATKQSLEIEQSAIEQCSASDIKIYGICLNKDGTANLDEFKNMTSQTSGSFLEVKSSENLVSALKDFYAQIFNTKFIVDTETIKDGVATKSTEVPKYGVEELNITINNASKLTGVTLTKPNGEEISDSALEDISSVIGDYYFIKIKSPDAGLWGVTARGQEGTVITFDFVFNTNSTSGDLVTINITKIFNRKETLNIGQYFTDNEDQNLDLSIIASTYSDGDIEGSSGNEIILKNLVDGNLTVQAKYNNGVTVKRGIQIKVKNLTWVVLLGAGIILLIIIGIILLRVIEAKKRFFASFLNVFSASEVDDSNSTPASNFTGKYKLSNFCLTNDHFDQGMYFKVLPDKNVRGNGSHKLRLISAKPFYYLSPSGEIATKSLDMETGMNYKIRSSSSGDGAGIDDTICISL